MTEPPPDAHADHRRRMEAFQREVEQLDSRANRVSLLRLGLFGGAVVVGVAGITQSDAGLVAGGSALLALFVVAVVVHLRLIARRDLAQIRRDVHERHVKRLAGEWLSLRHDGAGLLPADHDYALDIDLVGPGSLFQRIDVTHTVRGERTLASWLGNAATPDEVAARQAAVEELARDVELRQELEASAQVAAGDGKLDADPFLEFTRLPSFFEGRRWLVPVIHVLPVLLMGALVLGELGWAPRWAWTGVLVVSALVAYGFAGPAHRAFELVAARRGFVEAFHRMLLVVERAKLDAPRLVAIQKHLALDDVPPSAHMRRLDRWAGFADLRTQFPIHLVANVFLIWDLHVLHRLEAWNRDVGRRVAAVFDALGEMEALASLAALRAGDPTTSYPEVGAVGEPFEAEALAHPLLQPAIRVANDVALHGPGTALIVTGSNMAGKSTLLRAVGTNVALALAGGPVCAARMRVPPCRLRASMRADDSLQRGASYFHAELTKLRRVVADADGDPPVFFLLDELLRGTNACARHLGARSVLMHLLERNATGLVATHDIALSELEEEHPDRVGNAHFTDVVIDGEMTFDYRLRPGVVRTSNALRLLRMAGIEVPDSD